MLGCVTETLTLFNQRLTFFTTEHTEEERRATEYCHDWGERLRATQDSTWRALFLQEVAFLRGPPAVLRVLRGKKGQRLGEKGLPI